MSKLTGSCSGITTLATIHWDISDIDLSPYPTKMLDGRLARRIGYEHRIYFGHKRGVLYFACYMAGKEVGVTTVNFDDGSDDGDAAADFWHDGGSRNDSNCVVQ